MDPEEELRFLILGIQRDGNRALAAQLAPLGVTPSQAEAVRCLADAGPISLNALGEILVCEAGSPSRLVNTLVERGLVLRRENAEDRRHVVLTLSEAGRVLDTQIRAVENALYAWMSHRLGASNIEVLNQLLWPLLADGPASRALGKRKRS